MSSISLYYYARQCVTSVLDVVFPQGCAACRQVIHTPSMTWCDACAIKMLEATSGLHCPTCGRGVGPYEVVDNRCGRCSSENHRHDGLVRVGAYTSVIRSLVRQYKFAGQQRLDRTLGRMLAARIEGAPWRNRIECLVPVPSHWTGRWKRGFFSTGALTVEASRILRLPDRHLLKRAVRGRSQIGLNATQRKNNVHGVFALARRAKVEGRVVCLVDDVMVTGATIRENVRILRKAGAAAVYVAVLAKADPADAVHADA